MTKILFEELHPNELKQIIQESGTVFLPLGSLEWHERHLPFGLDAYVSHEICKRVCKRTGGCVIPPVYFGTDREYKVDGKTFHGMDARAKKILPGSIYFLKQDLFYQFLKSIAKNTLKNKGSGNLLSYLVIVEQLNMSYCLNSLRKNLEN